MHYCLRINKQKNLEKNKMNKQNIEIAEKTLQMLKKKSWDKISINQIIKKNHKARKSINTKKDLLININRYVDFHLKQKIVSIDESNTKDMLFELIMLRFDILQQHRDSFLSLFNFYKSRPQKSLVLIPSFLESMFLVASIANIEIHGLKGSLKIKGIFITYFATYFEWLNDKSQSLDKTMIALDKNLDRFSKILNYL